MTTSFLVAASRFVGILCADGERDAAASGELRGHDRLARRACFYEIVQNAVRYRFVEGALVSIGSKIKLKRLALDTESVGHVVDVDPGKIWLASDWANRSEIVRFEMNPVIPTRRRIWESLEPRFGR